MNDPYVTHLGDGCYVRYTEYSLLFMANSHIDPTDTVSMDMPSGLDQLTRFVEKCRHVHILMQILGRIGYE